MLFASYITAAAAMTVALFYLFLRLKLVVTTTTMLFISLLLVYGPAALSFTLSGGEYMRLIRGWTNDVAIPPSMFPMIKDKVGDLGVIITNMNFSLALMYVGSIAGVEIINRLFPSRARETEAALASWSGQPLRHNWLEDRILLLAISALFALMLFFTIKENHLGTVAHFFRIEGDNTERNLFRSHFGGSPNYIYRILLAAIAPMLVIWGFFAGIKDRAWPLLLATLLLFLVTLIGKIETLSKGPPAFFLIQIALASMLAFTNRISLRVAFTGLLLILLVIYVITRAIIIFPEGTSVIGLVYSRIFEVENETLVENFAVFPHLHPFTWGANIRPIAMLMGRPYVPSFSLVGYIWYGSPDITSPTLFIADAWADFAYAGVLVYSIIAGMVCRGIDITFLAKGKSVVGIAVLGATFWGVLTLITTALNIALLSGGLLLAPLVAAILMVATRSLSRTPEAVNR